MGLLLKDIFESRSSPFQDIIREWYNDKAPSIINIELLHLYAGEMLALSRYLPAPNVATALDP
ncbi:hypothetical protein [Bartonella massiliensis]|uniref:hypothetical protein n=1 Tax=Bartonella massiliensis TaxID=929795 RepID=UPI001157AAD4|nr:hypothetical protein [Bartonella massiliensis]